MTTRGLMTPHTNGIAEPADSRKVTRPTPMTAAIARASAVQPALGRAAERRRREVAMMPFTTQSRARPAPAAQRPTATEVNVTWRGLAPSCGVLARAGVRACGTVSAESGAAGATRGAAAGDGAHDENAAGSTTRHVDTCSSTGISTAAAMAHAHTMCLTAADDRRSASATSHAAAQIPIIRRDAVTNSAIASAMSRTLLPRPLDHVGEPLPVVTRQLVRVIVDQGGNRLRGGAVEEGVQQMAHRRTLRPVPLDPRQVDVARTVLLVPDVPLLLENAQQRSYGRIAGGLGYRLLDLRDRGAPGAVEHVEDLALAPADVRWC